MGITELLNSLSIRLRNYGVGSHKTTCPQCSALRKKKTEPCLSVTIAEDHVIWLCHNAECGWAGRRNLDNSRGHDRPYQPTQPAKLPHLDERLPQAFLDFFARRGISKPTLLRAGVRYAPGEWFAQSNEARNAIAFPYVWNKQIVNVKFRTLDKEFKQVRDGEKIPYLSNLCDLELGDWMVWTEGEIDALSLLEAKVDNAVSVPDGAPAKLKHGEIDPDEDRKFSYVWNARSLIDGYSKHILATDDDEPGRALRDELARRIGKERCWIVFWPEGCKDANDVLVRYGADKLREVIDNHLPYPITGIHTLHDFLPEARLLYAKGHERGLHTGWDNLSPFYTVAQGQLTVVTGVPNAGKSEWLDALVVNLAKLHGWRFGVASFENPPADHLTRLAEKRLGKPFHPGPTPRMELREFEEATAWLAEYIFFIRPASDDDLQTLEFILEKARVLVTRYGIRGLVIDPWNELESSRPDGMTETEYVSKCLGRLKRFAQANGIHIWIVAHPRQLRPWTDKKGEVTIPLPTLYDISGSAHWANKADCGIVIERKDAGGVVNTVVVHVKKMRFKWAGRQGSAILSYDRVTSCFTVAPEPGNDDGGYAARYYQPD